MQSEEDFSIVSGWAYLADVPRYGICERRNEGTYANPALLFRRSDEKSFLFPVHVFETKPLDFTYAQSIYSEQGQNGSITDVGLTVPFCAGQKPLHSAQEGPSGRCSC